MLNKNILLTGGTSGIGFDTARKLVSAGSNVIVVSRSEEKLKKTREILGEKIITYKYDLSDVKNIGSLINTIYDKHVVIDGFVHCAGFSDRRRFKDLSYDVIDNVMKINFYSFTEILRCLSVRKKKSSELRSVCISSHASSSNEKFLLAYAASKASLECAVRILANELRSKNITVTCVRPAFVNTPFISSMNSLYEDFGNYLKQSGYQPCGLIPPDTVSSMIIHMLSPDAFYYSGTCIDIPAGASN